MKKLFFAALLSLATYAHASSTLDLGCSQSDLSGVNFIKCSGYVEGNLLNNNSSNLSFVQSIFSNMGYTNVSTSWAEKLTNLNGTNTIDFSTPLSGITIVGIHKGGAGESSQSTAFYVIDAGKNLDSFKYNLSGSSNATIYSVGSISPVPEPNTSTLLMVGTCVLAWLAYRKGQKTR